MTVYFENVGRFKQSWSVDLESLSDYRLVESVRERGRLMSSQIDVVYDEDGRGGSVVVGGWRCVGRFRIEGGVAMRVRLA